MIRKAHGIVLDLHDYSETSLIVNFFTREFGKVKCLVKGAKKKNSGYGSQFALFSLNRIVYYEKTRSSLFLLTECEMVEYFGRLRTELTRMAHAGYLVEFTASVSHLGDANARLFDVLLASLRMLCTDDVRKVARTFEVKALSATGFMPQMERCASCKSAIGNESAFSPMLGGVLCSRCARQDANSLRISQGTRALILYIRDMDFLALSRVRITGRMQDELEALLKAFVHYHTEMEPKSLQFLRKIGAYEVEEFRSAGVVV